MAGRQRSRAERKEAVAMLDSEIQSNRFYVTKDNRIVLPYYWDAKKQAWAVMPSRRGGGLCKSEDIVREIDSEEARQMMEFARWGGVPYLLHWKQFVASLGVNMILPWEPLPKDYVPPKRKKRRSKADELITQWF
jgi:hypothetical protein